MRVVSTARGDVVHLTNVIPLGAGATATAVVDGYTVDGCLNDVPHTGVAFAPQRGLPSFRPTIDIDLIDNLLPIPPTVPCSSEVVVIARDNALQLKENLQWTPAPTDKLPVAMTTPVVMPVTIWVLVDQVTNEDGTVVNVRDMAALNGFHASVVYNWQRAGMAFGPVTVTSISGRSGAPGRPGASDLLASHCGARDDFHDLAFAQGQLNVYYINVMDLGGPARGQWCGGDWAVPRTAATRVYDQMAVVSAGIADGESLAHELGHMFTLEHVNRSGNFDPNFTGTLGSSNIMYSGGYARTSFTYGQVFRMNVNQPSAINVLGRRPGAPTRWCQDGPTAALSMSCPARWLTVP